MTAPIPLCVIGAGLIGQRHIEVALQNPAIKLAAVVEPDPARRDELQTAGLPAVASISDAPAGIAAAIVATPTPDHHASAMAALDRGWAVLVEKPLTATMGEARALCAVADDKGLPLITGHHRRCHPFTQAARELLDQIGPPVAVQALWSLRKHDSYYDVPWRRAPGAGPLMTNISHEIDLMRFLLGDIAEVQAMTSNARRGLAVEDTAAVSLRFDDGVLGSVLISDVGASPWAFEAASGENPGIAASGQDYLRIIGTDGALAFPSLTLWGRAAPGEIEWRKPLARTETPQMAVIDPIAEQLTRFARIAQGHDDPVLATGPDGAATLEITLAAALSGETGTPVRRGGVPEDYRGLTATK
ncbi:Gfo/Idh/MocA family oxidoreductase [Seohaeicola saemankumensis]|nr:Gfo/Idh/MocA family oxidoreductase [Seohaeicola saemankumensis]MCA0873108.1 Gfo/Idh/MocA family oxidoreductase [Seohaeicola saemankumensis]